MKTFNSVYNSLILEFSEGAIKKLIEKFKKDASEQDIRRELDDFEKYKNSIQQKDPFQYKSWLELTEVIHAAKGKAEVKKGKAPESQDVDVDKDDIIAEDDNVVIYRGDSQDKCVLYGNNYTFCISKKSGGNMYTNYRLRKNSTFYFIYFKKKPKTAKDHIMVLDRNKNGYEWTFADNDTQPVDRNTLFKKYPELLPYENLFINKPLDKDEKNQIEIIQDFQQNPSLEKFKTFDYKTKVNVLKAGIPNLPDDIYKTLDSLQINEFLSTGPNLTPYQADSLKPNQINWYVKNRNISARQLLDYYKYKFNKHDVSVLYIKDKIEEGKKIAEQFISRGNYNLSNLFLFELPSNIPDQIDGNFDCSYNQLTTLKGAPRKVGGDFTCNNSQLTSLEGAPDKIDGRFYCKDNLLTSLEGSPSSVGGNFDCFFNQLTTLEGAPSSIGGYFDCSHNQLTTLEGSPSSVGGNFDCSHNQLTTLEGAPSSIGGYFDCNNNQLKSLEGAPNSVGGFYCNNNRLTTLKGAPREVGGNFNCGVNQLTTLEGAPSNISGYFDCRDNQLTSLEGAPSKVIDDFYCNNNRLTTLKGAPREVGGDFACNNNQLKSLEGAPSSVGDFYCGNNPVKFTQEDIKKAMEQSQKRLKIQKESYTSQLQLLENLRDWFKPHKDKKGKTFRGWINCKTGGPCGRKDTSKGSYPACRPTKAQCKNIKGRMYKKKSSKRVSWKNT